MKKLEIEWKHYDKEGKTCVRCKSTGQNIEEALQKISEDVSYKNIEIDYKETILSASEMPDSNTVIINGRKLEDILSAETSENYCHSCSCLADSDTNCRTIKFGNENYDSIPKEMILEAISSQKHISNYSARPDNK